VRPGELKEGLRASSSLWRTFHDTGELRMSLDQPERVVAELRGYGASSREMCRVIGGYVTEVASVAARRDVATTKVACTLDGAPQCSWRMTLR
jgi:hypothetical protein